MPDDLIDLPLGEDDDEPALQVDESEDGPQVAVRQPPRRQRKRRLRRRSVGWAWWLLAGTVLAAAAWLILRPPQLDLTPAEVPPIRTPVGEASEPIEVGIHNPGRRAVSISDISVTGDTGFSVGRRDCGDEIGAGEACRVQVVFAPLEMGVVTTELEVVGSQRGGISSLAIEGEGLGARLVADDAVVDFGATTVDGQSAPQTIRIHNKGTLAGRVGAITIDGADFRLAANDCRAALEPGSSCDIEVVFRPQGLGDREAVLAGESAVARPLSGVRLRGRGTGPGFEIRPMRVEFGEQKVGTNSSAQEVVWLNQSDQAWRVRNPQIEGEAFDLISDSCARSPVPIDGSCRARVVFSPSSPGPASGRLTLVHRDGERFPAVELRGVATAAELDFDLRRVGFPATPVGRTSPPRTLRLTNNGSAAAARVAIGIDGDGATSFRLSHDCGSTLAAGDTCALRLSLAPRQAGEVSATVRVDSDAPQSPLRLPLVGNGASPRMQLTRDRLDFATVPRGESQELQLAIENPGSAALEIKSVRVEGEGFLIAGDECTGSMVVAGGDCGVLVRFQPTRQGAHTGSVEVLSAAGGGRVSLSGLAAAPPTPRVEVEPTSIQFDVTRVGDRSQAETITVISHGPGRLSVRSVEVEGESARSFRLVPGTCDLGSLVAGGRCSIGVRFQPLTEGGQSAGVVVRSNGEPAVLRVSLSGETMP